MELFNIDVLQDGKAMNFKIKAHNRAQAIRLLRAILPDTEDYTLYYQPCTDKYYRLRADESCNLPFC